MRNFAKACRCGCLLLSDVFLSSCRAGNKRGGGKVNISRTSRRCAINACNAIIDSMTSITIRNLEDSTKRKLKIRAAMHGRSMEQEAREILKSALRQKPQEPKSGAELVKRIRAIWEPLGGIELEPLPREPMRDPEWLKDWK